MQENIFCKQCGKPGAKSDKFCKFCGMEINSDSIDSIPEENSQNVNEDIISDEVNKLFAESTGKFILASRLKRLFARLLDGVFGLISALIPGFVLTFISGGSFDPESYIDISPISNTPESGATKNLIIIFLRVNEDNPGECVVNKRNLGESDKTFLHKVRRVPI